MGQGIITVSSALFEDQHVPQTLAEWQTLLMLPDELRLLEAKSDVTHPYWNITVEHEAIPTVEGKQVEVVPIFTRQYNEEDGTSTTRLERIDLRVPTEESSVIWQRG